MNDLLRYLNYEYTLLGDKGKQKKNGVYKMGQVEQEINWKFRFSPCSHFEMLKESIFEWERGLATQSQI